MLDNLMFSLNATIPLFLMMALGYFLKKINFLKDPVVIQGMNKAIFKVFLPLLLFKDLSTIDFFGLWDTSFVLFGAIATITSIFIAWILTLVFGKKEDKGEMIQASYRSATASLGIAFMSNIYSNVSMVSLMIISCVPIYNIAAVIVLTFFEDSSKALENNKKHTIPIGKTLKNIITNPIILGVLIGAVWAMLRIPQPVIFSKTVSSLAAVASPLSLVVLGATFEFSDITKHLKPIIVISFSKLMLFCMIFLPIAIKLGFTDEKLVAILIMLGSGTTSSCFIMAKNMGHEGSITSGSIMITTLLSSFTLTLWLFILKSFAYI